MLKADLVRFSLSLAPFSPSCRPCPAFRHVADRRSLLGVFATSPPPPSAAGRQQEPGQQARRQDRRGAGQGAAQVGRRQEAARRRRGARCRLGRRRAGGEQGGEEAEAAARRRQQGQGALAVAATSTWGVDGWTLGSRGGTGLFRGAFGRTALGFGHDGASWALGVTAGGALAESPARVGGVALVDAVQTRRCPSRDQGKCAQREIAVLARPSYSIQMLATKATLLLETPSFLGIRMYMRGTRYYCVLAPSPPRLFLYRGASALAEREKIPDHLIGPAWLSRTQTQYRTSSPPPKRPASASPRTSTLHH